jgi:lipopolysaccharide/colanic/teichoic acid biosynthesis glycosyltransferase
MMHRKPLLEEMPRCAAACNYGRRRFVTEEWFAQALRLERKRTERSRKPFILVLLNIESFASLNGSRLGFVNQVVNALASFMRETDVTGWYRDGSVLGNIFTELGTSCIPSASVASIRAKINLALETHVGPEMSAKIKVSCHVFPEDWTEQKPNGRIDSMLYPELEDKGRPGWLHSAGKRMVDILLSSLALVLSLPVFLLVAAAVKLSSKGPVLFRQERIGQRGKRFTFLKFRSMHERNQSMIHEQYVRKLISGSLGVPLNGVFKIQNDPRVTRVGRFLRKTSLDELPQFWNVLIGDMSLVGPRPPLPYEVEVYDIWHRRRVLEAKPGITGLWQVTGRSRTCFDDMVRLDLHYTQSSSLWLDMKILLQTPRAVLAGDGAY